MRLALDGDLRVAANALVQLNGRAEKRRPRRRNLVEEDSLIAQQLPAPAPYVAEQVQQVGYQAPLPSSSVGPAPAKMFKPASMAEPLLQVSAVEAESVPAPEHTVAAVSNQAAPIATSIPEESHVQPAVAEEPVQTVLGESWYPGNSDSWD